MCARCGLVYLSPRPAAADFGRFYRDLYPRLYGKTSVSSGPSARGTEVFGFVAGRLADGDSVLDVGCGDGGLLRAFTHESATRGPSLRRLVGCEPGWAGDGGPLEQDGRSIEIWTDDVLAHRDELGGFDLVVLYDVLEHLLEPRRFLALLREAAAPETRLFISTSCLDHVDAIPPAGWETYYLRLAHTFTFTRATLRGLLEAGGWRAERTEPAPKGDQWVLCVAAEPSPAPTLGSPGETLALIERYRERCT